MQSPIKDTIKTDFATFELTAHDVSKPFKVKSISEIPYGFFNLGNARGQRFAIALQVFTEGPAPLGYQLGNTATLLADAVEAMRDVMNNDLRNSAPNRSNTENEVNYLKFDYQYPRHAVLDEKRPRDTHAPKIEEILRASLTVREEYSGRFGAGAFLSEGWSISRTSIQFRINADYLKGAFYITRGDLDSPDFVKNYGITGTMDAHEGVISLHIPQLDHLDFHGVFQHPRWSVDLQLEEGFWYDVLTELNAGLVKYNKMPHLPEKLKVGELSSINHDRMTTSKSNKGKGNEQIFELYKLRDWFNGRG